MDRRHPARRILWRRGWLRIEAEAWRRVPRIMLATLVMGAFIAGVDALLASWLNISGSSFARIKAALAWRTLPWFKFQIGTATLTCMVPQTRPVGCEAS